MHRRRTAALSAAAGLLMFMRSAWAASPDADRIRNTVQEVLAKGPYRLDPSSYYSIDLWWILEPLRWLVELIAKPFAHASWPVAMAIVTALVILLAALIAHILYSFYVAIRGSGPPPLAKEAAILPNPDALETQAERLAAEQNYADATRTLFRAALARLERKRGGRMLSTLTNREYLKTFRTPWIVENLSVFVDVIQWKWYRDRRFEREDYLLCQGAYQTLRTRLNEPG